MNRRMSLWMAALAVAAALALGFKLHIARTTVGTTDVRTWKRFANEVRTLGVLETYHVDKEMNHPPFMALVLQAIHAVDERTTLAFPFWMRLPAILADVAMLLIVAWRYPPISHARGAALLLLALAPPLIMISGFHGNTDTVMITFACLAAVILDRGLHPALAGIAFGMSLNIKIVPIILTPALLLSIVSWRGRLTFALATAMTAGLPALPYVLAEPRLILRNVIAYDSLFGRWGYTRLLRIFEEQPGAAIAEELSRNWGRALVLGSIIVVSLWQARTASRSSAFWRCGTAFATFLTLTPGFGVQYLAWMVPWVIALGPGAVLTIYGTSGLFLFEVYDASARAWPWEYAGSGGVPGWSPYPHIVRLELIAWVAICASLIMFVARTPRNPVAAKRRMAAPPTPHQAP